MWSFPFQALPYISGAPAWERLGSGTASNQSVLILPNFPGGYRLFLIAIDDAVPVLDAARLNMRTRQQGQPSFDSGASAYSFATYGLSANSGVLKTDVATASTAIRIASGNGQRFQADGHLTAQIVVHNPRDETETRIAYDVTFRDTATELHSYRGSGTRSGSHDVEAVQFLYDVGNISTMNWALYGLRAS